MGKAEPQARTKEIVLREYTTACALSKENSVPKKARPFENLDLYVECKKLGCTFDELDKAASGKPAPYDVSTEPLVMTANDAIKKRGRGALGDKWRKATALAIETEAAWRVALDAKTAAIDAETLAHVAVVGGEDVSLPGKGVDGASLAVAFTLFVDDDDAIDVSNGAAKGAGSGPAAPLIDGKYMRTRKVNGKVRTARMTVAGETFTVSQPVSAEGDYASATKAAQSVTGYLGYSSDSVNGRKFWKAA